MKYLLIFLLVACSQTQSSNKQVVTQTFEIKETRTTTFEIYY
jgi:hypothetical protein